MNRQKSILALLLLVPAPSIGTLAAMFIVLYSYCSLPVATACALGVFLGGAAWSFIT